MFYLEWKALKSVKHMTGSAWSGITDLHKRFMLYSVPVSLDIVSLKGASSLSRLDCQTPT